MLAVAKVLKTKIKRLSTKNTSYLHNNKTRRWQEVGSLPKTYKLNRFAKIGTEMGEFKLKRVNRSFNLLIPNNSPIGYHFCLKKKLFNRSVIHFTQNKTNLWYYRL